MKWLRNFSVINNFNFLYMSWVFCPVFSFSTFNWKFKTISIRNYKQHFTFKKAWEEFCRNFIRYIWKSFKLVVISNIAMKLIAVAPWSGFPIKMIAVKSIVFKSCKLMWTLSLKYIMQWLKNWKSFYWLVNTILRCDWVTYIWIYLDI